MTRAALVILLVLAGLTAEGADPPVSPREFRAVWVATVGNIDWPSKPGLSVEEQQREAGEILDEAARLHFNAVVFQVRPAADALYLSELEPWSYYLTGRQGIPPEPVYDPLDYWIEQAHLRGLQLHAWFNPFRARIGGAKYELHPSHVSHAHPKWVKTYGNSLWLDPGEDEARTHTLRVIADVTRRYDLDGIHIDDYFYPYPVGDPETKKEIDFPDGPSWDAYRRSGGTLERGDWRRSNVNRLIEEMYAVVRRLRPNVLVGISPFGIPRPGLPKGVVGFDQHDKLYADTLLWLRSGWCDYWTPQLYWKVDSPGQPYRPLLEYWIEQNAQKRHIWPGLSVSRVGDGKTSYAPEEILSQIDITRQTGGASGNVLFSMRALQANRRGLCDRLLEGALSPAGAGAADAMAEDRGTRPARGGCRRWGDRDSPRPRRRTVRVGHLDARGGRVDVPRRRGADSPAFRTAWHRRGGRHRSQPPGRREPGCAPKALFATLRCTP